MSARKRRQLGRCRLIRLYNVRIATRVTVDFRVLHYLLLLLARKKEAQPARKMAEGPRKKLADQTGATSLPSSSIKKY